MVGRLVEEQQIGARAERPGERGARQLAAREALEWTLQIAFAEAKPARGRLVARAPAIAARVLEPRLRAGIASQRRRIVSSRRHRRFQLGQLPLGVEHVGAGGEHVRAQIEAALERRTLVVQGDLRALGQRQLAGLQLGPAGDCLYQRRLSDPVSARQSHPLSALQREGDALEEERPGELLA